ncbi:MAG: hypothetical protein B9S34_03185 [Opitutia bacterium Tous-C1TDCM]|nr:MAG: hypothetical protein B9S34_03185 [Opitutae bacterium Tous-C1TDCM]
MNAPVRWLVLLLSLGVAGYGVYAYFTLTPGTTVHPEMRAAYAAHPARILIHVAGSAVALLVGPLQFFPAIRAQRHLHRALGYIYFAGVMIGGGAGFATAFIAFGGLVSQVGFGLLAVVWILATLLAVRAARQGDFARHEVWALRSFALTFSAVTLRIYLGTSFAAGVPFASFYPLLAWLCWVPNLLVIEWFVLRATVATR